MLLPTSLPSTLSSPTKSPSINVRLNSKLRRGPFKTLSTRRLPVITLGSPKVRPWTLDDDTTKSDFTTLHLRDWKYGLENSPECHDILINNLWSKDLLCLTERACWDLLSPRSVNIHDPFLKFLLWNPKTHPFSLLHRGSYSQVD